MSNKYIDSFLNGKNRNLLKEKFRDIDLNLASEISSELFLFKIIKGSDANGNEDNFFVDMNRSEFQQNLDKATTPVSVNLKENTKSIITSSVDIFLAEFNNDGSPIKVKKYNYSSTPNFQVPDIVTKLITTQNSFSIFTTQKNINPDSNYFASKQNPDVNLSEDDNYETNLIGEIKTNLFYASSIDEVFDDNNNIIGYLMNFNSIRNVRKEDGEGNFYEWTLRFKLNKKPPKNIKYIEIITYGFSGFSPRGAQISNGERNIPVFLEENNFSNNDKSLLACHFSHEGSQMFIRDANSTELLALNKFLETIRDDNFNNHNNVPDTTFSLITSIKHPEEEYFRPDRDSVDPFTLEYESRYHGLVTNNFYRSLNWQNLNDDKSSVPVKTIYSNFFYSEGLQEDYYQYFQKLRIGSGEDGDLKLTLIGDSYLKLSKVSITNYEEEDIHPWELSNQKFLHDYVVFRNKNTGGNTQDSFYLTQFVQNINWNDYDNYKDFLNSGYVKDGFSVQKRWPDMFEFSETPNSSTMNFDTNGVYHILINKNIYKEANDIKNESNNNYIIEEKNLSYYDQRAHKSSLPPVNKITVNIPSPSNFSIPLLIDFNKFNNQKTIWCLELEDIVPTLTKLSLWIRSSNFEVRYLDSSRNIIKRDFRNNRLDSPNNLHQFTYV